MRQLTEVHVFTREDIERACMGVAKAKIIGGMYVGCFGTQRAEWQPDGSLHVLTTHAPAEAGDTAPKRKR